MIGRLFVASAAATLLIAPPAHGALLKGTVTGSPYVASATAAAVPVTFSKQTAQRAGLRSPVGVLVVPRGRAVPTPDGPVAPTALRLGDRFRFTSAVSAAARAAVYTRLATSRLSVYKRSRTLTNDELTTQLLALVQYVGELQAGLARGDRDVAAVAGAVGVLQQALTELLRRLPAGTAPEVAATVTAVQQQLAALAGGGGGLLGGVLPAGLG